MAKSSAEGEGTVKIPNKDLVRLVTTSLPVGYFYSLGKFKLDSENNLIVDYTFSSEQSPDAPA